MLRESLHGSARTASLLLTRGHGLLSQFRGTTAQSSDLVLSIGP